MGKLRANGLAVLAAIAVAGAAARAAGRIGWGGTTRAPELGRGGGLPPPQPAAEASEIWEAVEHGKWLGCMPWLDATR